MISSSRPFQIYGPILLSPKLFINIFFSSKPKYLFYLLRAFSWHALLLHRTMIAWNFSGFTIILFILNQPVSLFSSLYKYLISCDNVLDEDVIMLSSAKLCNSEFLVLMSRSFIKTLIKMVPSIDPWGTPDKRIWKILHVLFILTFCLRFLRYE